MPQLLHVKVSGNDGNDYTFYYNGSDDIYELIRHIKSSSLIDDCCDEFGEPTGVVTSFMSQNIIRVNVKCIEAKVKPEPKVDPSVAEVEQEEAQTASSFFNLIDTFVSAMTPNQEAILDWVESVDQSPKGQEPEPSYEDISIMNDDSSVFKILVEQ